MEAGSIGSEWPQKLPSVCVLGSFDRSSQSVSEARPAKVDLILADTSGKMDTWRNPVVSQLNPIL
jgi:hypothetical protein